MKDIFEENDMPKANQEGVENAPTNVNEVNNTDVAKAAGANAAKDATLDGIDNVYAGEFSEHDHAFNRNITIILVSVIAIILILLGVVGYIWWMNKQTDEAAKRAAEQFDKSFANQPLKDDGKNVNTSNNINVGNLPQEDIQSTANGRRQKYETYDMVGTINIPKTGITYPILYPVEPRSLEIAVAMLYTTNGLNKPGNTTILGHNWKNNMFFSKNTLLKPGDDIYIRDLSGRQMQYKVYKGYYTTPSDASYMMRNTQGKAEISLSTCNDDSSKRYIVLARQVG